MSHVVTHRLLLGNPIQFCSLIKLLCCSSQTNESLSDEMFNFQSEQIVENHNDDVSPLLRTGGKVSKCDYLLRNLIADMGKSTELVSFVRHLCSEPLELFFEYFLNSFKSKGDKTVSNQELIVKLVEPICSQLFSSFAAGVIPHVLSATLTTLNEFSSPSEPISVMAALAESFVPNVIHDFKNKFHSKLSSFLSDEVVFGHMDSLFDRLKILLFLAFDVSCVEGERSGFSLCLAESAALSRSKWLINRHK